MKKKKILLLSDDLRMSSGVGTVSKEFVIGTIDRYDWVQMGGAIKHPDEGKVIDMRDAIKEEEGKDGYLKIYPVSGYGNPETLRSILRIEKPDAIMIYTDPRFWMWLFQMERELRYNIPIFYYAIWDDLPDPMWNAPFYESCDLIMSISKQSTGIHKRVLEKAGADLSKTNVTYVPHGINSESFRPVDDTDGEFTQFKEELQKDKEYSFIVYYNNRNIRRKNPGDVIMSFKTFVETLPEDEQKKCALVMHTHPVDNNGTDLPAVAEAMAPDLNVIFSGGKLDIPQMNFLYNVADVTINIASNEGFGLGTAESLMAGTPVVVNVTGGLQDQCGFKYKNKYLTADDYYSIKSLHDKRKWKNNDDLTWGEWVKPVWPACRSLQGSVPTPYIFDDRTDFIEVAEKLREWYDTSKSDRDKKGLMGRQWMMNDDIYLSSVGMCERFIEDMDEKFENWQPRSNFDLVEV
ncbi:MAG: glycosyltransferase [Pelagibacteraceae bacterium]|nr:glycosyltransferase [Pelagibacteraceae bacterium]